jgi:hypothetical protein
MTSQEYTQWLKGFLDAIDNYAITKRQFDTIREKLKEVDDTIIGTPIGIGGFGTPGTPYWGGTATPYSIPLSGTITTGGTITTSNYPSGSTITYTTGNSSGTYTLTGNNAVTPTSAVFVNQSSNNELRSKYLKDSEGYESIDELENDFFSEDDDKLLLD